MSEDVKPRSYDNSRRQEKARETKRDVVTAAHDLFVRQGFVDTTVEAISAAASVPIATVYRLFGTKAAILKEVIDIAIAGDDMPVAVGDRPLAVEAKAAPDAHTMTAAFARLVQEMYDRSASLRLALRAAALVDNDAAELEASMEVQRRMGQARISRALASGGFLRPGLPEREARDIVYALVSLEVYRILRLEQRWSGTRYERWLADALYRELVSE